MSEMTKVVGKICLYSWTLNKLPDPESQITSLKRQIELALIHDRTRDSWSSTSWPTTPTTYSILQSQTTKIHSWSYSALPNIHPRTHAIKQEQTSSKIQSSALDTLSQTGEARIMLVYLYFFRAPNK